MRNLTVCPGEKRDVRSAPAGCAPRTAHINYQLKKLCRQSREGSYATQIRRERDLTLIANQLHELGYRKLSAQSLKPKHVEALTKHWLNAGITARTIKNRMAAIRWWAHKVNRQNVVARSNEHYGIPDRRFVSNESKAKSVTQSQLDKVRDEHVRMSLELQQAFGLRHSYAQDRYEKLTGWKAPSAGGPESKALTPEQRELDREARLTISRELGHEREAVTCAYLGR